VTLVGVIGSTGMAGGYQLSAKSEGNAANRWRWMTVAAVVAAVGFNVGLIVAFDFEWSELAVKAFVTVPLLARQTEATPGTESAKHRREEQRNRRVELELASLEPILALLPETERQEIKKKLAFRYFGHSDDDHRQGGEVEAPEIVESHRN
jgi:hypothetical protein